MYNKRKLLTTSLNVICVIFGGAWAALTSNPGVPISGQQELITEQQNKIISIYEPQCETNCIFGYSGGMGDP